MKTVQRITLGALAAMLVGAPMQAQENARVQVAQRYIDERSGVTLEAAIARALEREPMIRAIRAGIDVALGQRVQAGLRPNPTVTLERREEPGGTDSATTMGAEWPLDLFRRSARVKTAEHELAATRLAVADRERLLAADVRLHYGITAAAARGVTIADELLATVQRQFDLARARADEGAIPPLERDVLDVETRRLQAERVRASARADVAMFALKRLIGMDPGETLLLSESLEALVSQTPDAGRARADESRVDVREADARVALAEAKVVQARQEGRLDLSLFGTYMRMDAGFPQRGVNPAGGLERVRGRFNYAAGGAMITWPLFNKNQGGVAAAQAEQAGAQLRREAAALAARSEVAAAQARDASARGALASYAGTTRELARKNLDVVRQTFELGRATLFDYLAEQRRYLDFEQAYTAALRDAWEARAALQGALGEMK
jgi:cobalt-zinc-cadmium efflux system outer membrane protein